MKILPGEQLSAAWFQNHCGIVTGSHMTAVLDFTKKGEPGASRKTYLRTKLGEILTGVAIQDNYVSREMLDGIEREPAGRVAYQREEGVLIEEIDFALSDEVPRFGGSFDGLVGDDGIIELKCPKAGTHLDWFLAGVVPEAHLPQINSYLAISGRAWCDFVSYCPMIAAKDLRLLIIRQERDQAAIDRIHGAVEAFNAEIDEQIAKLRQIVGPFELPSAVAQTVAREQTSADDGLGISDEDIKWAQGGFQSEKFD